MTMKRLTGPAAIVASCLLSSGALQAQAPSPAPQAPATSLTPQELNEQILIELKAIHQLLERLTDQQPTQVPPAGAVARLTNLTGYMLGRPDAPVTMVEFTDLQCPYCRVYASSTFDDIKRNWIDTGKLRYISRDFPLDFHPQSMHAARAARCAGEQDRFWEMRETLMRNANLLTPDYIARTAAGLNLEMKAFTACAASTKYDAAIAADTQQGATIDVEGTPTFVIGRTTGPTLEGRMIVGALPYASFDAKLKEALDQAQR